MFKIIIALICLLSLAVSFTNLGSNVKEKYKIGLSLFSFSLVLIDLILG